MNPIFNSNVTKVEIFHRSYNIDAKDNLEVLPNADAVFGIFGIIHETPVHPRYIGSTRNLREAVRSLFERPDSDGLKKFMQGTWVQMICYELVPNLDDEQLMEKAQAWISEYKPAVTETGDYPTYAYEWPYNDDGSLRVEYATPPRPSV